ncbi:MAG: M3 family oligoendopeptidase [Sedimentisphaerales bacterium]|nr:M3 family oligoendopeptidase [Sedimentisphaerales bacterium]
MLAQTLRELDISKLPAYQKRKFVPGDAKLTDPKVVTKLYQNLIERDINSTAELEKFLLDRSELDAAIDQTGSVIYIRMTCQTDDKQAAEAYTHFTKEIFPVVHSISDRLDRKFLESEEKYPLEKGRYKVYRRAVRSDIDLFTEDNIPLQTEERLLSQEYQTISGAMTVNFKGEEKTLPEMTKLLEEPDRSLRESAWRAISSRRLADAEKLDMLFDKMLSVRIQIAKNAGYANYRDYKFKERYRFDYTPEDCKNYHDAVKRTVVPILGQIMDRRAEQMGLESLRPWDMQVDEKGRASLKPFNNVEEYINGLSKIFGSVDSELQVQFDEMNKLGLLDLASRKGKAPGGYQCTLQEVRKPFIFTNAVGSNHDVCTLAHEGGHAFHAIASVDDPLQFYRHAPTEFCEVASMSMELFCMPYLTVFYNEDDTKRSVVNQLERTVKLLVSVAMIDSFQHWIYENPNHTGRERAEQWLKIYGRFSGKFEDWSGLEKEKESAWHRILHIFQIPFYYIEYGIAQLGALGLWQQFKEDKSKAICNYKKALSLGGSRPLPELFEAAGLKFDFTGKTIEPLLEEVARELGL